jgi:hypothetical protein
LSISSQRVWTKGEPKVEKRRARRPQENLTNYLHAQNIHVAHVVVDGLIESQQAIDFFGLEKGSRFPDGSVSACPTRLEQDSHLILAPALSLSLHLSSLALARRFDQKRCAKLGSFWPRSTSLLGRSRWI